MPGTSMHESLAHACSTLPAPGSIKLHKHHHFGCSVSTSTSGRSRARLLEGVQVTLLGSRDLGFPEAAGSIPEGRLGVHAQVQHHGCRVAPVHGMHHICKALHPYRLSNTAWYALQHKDEPGMVGNTLRILCRCA